MGVFRPSLDACVAPDCLWGDHAGGTLAKYQNHSHEDATLLFTQKSCSTAMTALLVQLEKGSRRIKYVQHDLVKTGVPWPSQNFGGHTAGMNHTRTHSHFTSDFDQDSALKSVFMTDLFHHTLLHSCKTTD